MKLIRFDGVKLFCEAISCGLEIEYVILSEGANQVSKDAVRVAISDKKISEDKIFTVSGAVFEKISEE